MFFVQLSFLFSVQCDKIGLVLKILATIFPYKSSPNIWWNFKAFAPIVLLEVFRYRWFNARGLLLLELHQMLFAKMHFRAKYSKIWRQKS